MNKRISILFFVLLSFRPVSVLAKPDVTVIPIKRKISFERSMSVTDCGEKAAGCTVWRAAPKIRVNCKRKKIILDFSNVEFLIQIFGRYKKNTLEFDHVLKHELTHVALYEGVAKKFYNPMAFAVLLRFEKSMAENKSCAQIQSDVYSVFRQYVSRMYEEAERQNALIDGEENYAYQWDQVRQKRSEKHSNVSRKKKASVASARRNQTKAKRQYNVDKPKNRSKAQKNDAEIVVARHKPATVVRQYAETASAEDVKPSVLKTDLKPSVLKQVTPSFPTTHSDKTAYAETNKQPSVSQNKVETVQNQSVPENKKTVAVKTDEHYTDAIKRVFSKMVEAFELDKKINNILENIKKRYDYLVSQRDDPALKNVKETEELK